MKYYQFGNNGKHVSVVGQGTAGIQPVISEAESKNIIECLQRGFELGMNHVDTAELYGEGMAERLVGKAIKEVNREEVFITTKCLPSRHNSEDIRKACKESMERMGIEYVDLYLFHWLEPHNNIQDIIWGLEGLVEDGLALNIGVSNFSLPDFKKAIKSCQDQGLVTNQIKLNVIEKNYLKDLDFYKEKGIIVTAYSPLMRNGLEELDAGAKKVLTEIAKKHEATIQQIAIAWLINKNNVITIPRAFSMNHVEENTRASEIDLSAENMSKIDKLKLNT